ncbi:hypothetical protein F4775DRAFT_557550 [Biscogniauxia sp. FL1348]|nr:hypothetical protein F4775DRAFT_557550 [Biscogniauxia sp. FL1348]
MSEFVCVCVCVCVLACRMITDYTYRISRPPSSPSLPTTRASRAVSATNAKLTTTRLPPAYRLRRPRVPNLGGWAEPSQSGTTWKKKIHSYSG